MTAATLRALYLERELEVARTVLTAFVIHKAESTAAKVGFRWKPTRTAPGTFEDLNLAFKHSVESGAPLPISSENSASVIYTTRAANFAMRFWHDVSHVRLALSFDVVDELELGLWHLEHVKHAGFDESGTVYRLLHADLVGQSQLLAYAGRFPLDQRRFVVESSRIGVDAAVLDEACRGDG
jgi:hypothetical protein